MAQDMNAFERELMSYSEFSANEITQDENKVPYTIRNFDTKMQKNDEASIFDKIYDIDDIEDEDQTSTSKDKSIKKNISKFVHALEEKENDQLQYRGRGRGRGRGNRCFNPGQPLDYKLSNTEEIQRRIRQTSGLGHSNELIVASIKAAQQEKKGKNLASNPNTPSGSRTPNSRTGTPNNVSSTSLNNFASPIRERSPSNSQHSEKNSLGKNGTNSPKSGARMPINKSTTFLKDYSSPICERSPRNGMVDSPNNSNLSTNNSNLPLGKWNVLMNYLSENELFSDASSDSYYTIQESSGDFTSDGKNEIFSSSDITSEFEEGVQTSPPNVKPEKSTNVVVETDKAAESVSSKPLPLSQMLKMGRADRKLKKIIEKPEVSLLNPLAKHFEPKQSSSSSDISNNFNEEIAKDFEPKQYSSSSDGSNNFNEEILSSTDTEMGQQLTESEEEELSQKLITQLLQADQIELEQRRAKKQKLRQNETRARQMQQHTNWLGRSYNIVESSNSTSSQSMQQDTNWVGRSYNIVEPSSSTSSHSEDTLSWRRRGSSPPRHNWNHSLNLKPLNIKSVKDFPTLK